MRTSIPHRRTKPHGGESNKSSPAGKVTLDPRFPSLAHNAIPHLTLPMPQATPHSTTTSSYLSVFSGEQTSAAMPFPAKPDNPPTQVTQPKASRRKRHSASPVCVRGGLTSFGVRAASPLPLSPRDRQAAGEGERGGGVSSKRGPRRLACTYMCILHGPKLVSCMEMHGCRRPSPRGLVWWAAGMELADSRC